MAKLNQTIDSDDDDFFADLAAVLRTGGKAGNFEDVVEKPSTGSDGTGSERLSWMKVPKFEIGVGIEEVFEPERGHESDELREGKRCSKQNQRPLGPLKSAHVKSLNFSPSVSKQRDDMNASGREEYSLRSSPRRKAKAFVDYSRFAPRLSDLSPCSSASDSEDSFTDLSGFIVPDSASEDERLPSRSRKWRDVQSAGRGSGYEHSSMKDRGLLKSSLDEKKNTGLIDLTSPRKEKSVSRLICPESPPRYKTPPRLSDRTGPGSDLDEPFRFSPPRAKSPHKVKDGVRPITPPSSPSKSRLQSPSKKHRVPPSPHRPSVDAFWSADVINDWNEQYSPKKTLKSPGKQRLFSIDEDVDEVSPSESPCMSPSKSPAKKDREAIVRRKGFEDRKHGLATSFLAEIDQAVGDGRVAALAESTGGIKVVWSKKLYSTAGRANWRRDAVRSKNADGTVSVAINRHHASIELAEKVIDDEDRLINVIAHEYCHLANFMISGIKDNPHGASFKQWAAKCTRAFRHRNVNVTTKHTYEIAYKYIWTCSSEMCGIEYKRHSKSIDPAKHSCGSCKSKLVQVQPVPRKGEGEGKRSEYQEFVKREHERVRRENPGAGFGEIMGVLGREFRESRKKVPATETVGTRSEVEVVKEDVGVDLDDMATKLDFLKLDS